MHTRFDAKVALVTGGGSGVGRSTAIAFARAGATVVVAGRNESSLIQTVKHIHRFGGDASWLIADVTQDNDVAAMIKTVIARHQRLDIAFNNAGILGPPAPIADIDSDTWDSVLNTNLTGVWRSMKYEIRHMRHNGGGSIINTASNIGAHQRIPSLGGYAVSKAAVSVLTRAAARDHIADGIRINSISPGPIDTTMSLLPGEDDRDRSRRMRQLLPIGRVGALDEVAAAVLWLASDSSGFTVGHDLVLDGGATA